MSEIIPTLEEMNALQGETNLISDNAVTWDDVAECDKERAREWLWRRRASQQLEQRYFPTPDEQERMCE